MCECENDNRKNQSTIFSKPTSKVTVDLLYSYCKLESLPDDVPEHFFGSIKKKSVKKISRELHLGAIQVCYISLSKFRYKESSLEEANDLENWYN